MMGWGGKDDCQTSQGLKRERLIHGCFQRWEKEGEVFGRWNHDKIKKVGGRV